MVSLPFYNHLKCFMLDVIDLDFDYQNIPLLKNVSFHLPEGGVLHLKGANGVGKTTLLQLIAGLHCPLSGQIQFQGVSTERQMDVYQRHICYIGHKTGLNPYLTVRENCLFDLHNGIKNRDIYELVMAFKLQTYLDYPCGLLSAGQRRQVSLLRLWMTSAVLWLLDEPLVALDDSALELLMNQIAIHRKKGGAVLLTSHQNIPLQSNEYVEYRL